MGSGIASNPFAVG